MKSPCIVQVLGPRDSGKTSSIVEALKILGRMGIRAAVIKHTHHEIDVRGKDTWRFVVEGGSAAAAAVKGSGEEIAIFARNLAPEDLIDILARMADAVIIEGYSSLKNKATSVLSAAEPSARPLAERIVEEVLRCRASNG